ncbi:MAG: glycosyltransferase family 4 protein, partial [Anaerolineales bacterium]|nr:glycosyltransferase family 4 protein [Anaerolineales bacterium]
PSLFWLNRRLHGRIRYPIISIVHHLRSSEQHPVWANWLYRQIERRYLASVDGFVFNSETTRQVVHGLAAKRPFHERPFHKRPFTVAHPAGDQFQPDFDPAHILARAHEPGPLRVLFVGNLIPRKNLHVLLAALAQLPLADWRLTVVGNTAVSPRYTRAIHQQIHQQHLQNNVTLLGPLADAQVAAQMAQSHLLAVPSSYEGFGIVYLEGMGFALPAIAGSGGAAHEIITAGVNGFLAGGVAELVQQITTLQQDRNRLAQMGLAAWQHYQAHPTWHDTGARIHQFLHEIKNARLS